MEGKVDIPAGSTFILWRLGNEETGPKLVELAPPDGDVRTTAILLLKVYHVQGNHYFGTRRINLTGPTAVTTSARFNVYENESDFGLMVDRARAERARCETSPPPSSRGATGSAPTRSRPAARSSPSSPTVGCGCGQGGGRGAVNAPVHTGARSSRGGRRPIRHNDPDPRLIQIANDLARWRRGRGGARGPERDLARAGGPAPGVRCRLTLAGPSCSPRPSRAVPVPSSSSEPVGSVWCQMVERWGSGHGTQSGSVSEGPQTGPVLGRTTESWADREIEPVMRLRDGLPGRTRPEEAHAFDDALETEALRGPLAHGPGAHSARRLLRPPRPVAPGVRMARTKRASSGAGARARRLSRDRRLRLHEEKRGPDTKKPGQRGSERLAPCALATRCSRT